MSIAAALIVRDAEDTIERCVRSVRPHVAQVCVYLAGESTDGTVNVLERLQRHPGTPIVIEQGSWRDDFSWARTQSFAMVAPEHKWITWLDSDDVLIGGDKLPVVEALAEQYGPVACATMMYEYKWIMGGGRIWDEPTSRDRFVHRDRCYWHGQVHEDLRYLPSFRDTPKLAVPYEQAHVKHQHELRPAGRYLALVERAAQDPERTPRGLFLLAWELCTVDRFEDALQPLMRYLNEGHDAIEGNPNGFRLAALALGIEITQQTGDAPMEGYFQSQWAAYSERLEQFKQDGRSRPVEASAKVGRNDPCDCGSGRKSKKCCRGVSASTAA